MEKEIYAMTFQSKNPYDNKNLKQSEMLIKLIKNYSLDLIACQGITRENSKVLEQTYGKEHVVGGEQFDSYPLQKKLNIKNEACKVIVANPDFQVSNAKTVSLLNKTWYRSLNPCFMNPTATISPIEIPNYGRLVFISTHFMYRNFKLQKEMIDHTMALIHAIKKRTDEATPIIMGGTFNICLFDEIYCDLRQMLDQNAMRISMPYGATSVDHHDGQPVDYFLYNQNAHLSICSLDYIDKEYEHKPVYTKIILK